MFRTSIHSYFSVFNMIMLLQVNDDKEKGLSVGTKSISEQLVEEVGPHLTEIILFYMVWVVWWLPVT